MFDFSIGSSIARRITIALFAVALLASVLLLPPTAAFAAEAGRYIVEELPQAGDGPEQLVGELGGEVGAQLGLIGGFVAELPSGAADALADHPEVAAVTLDGRLTFLDWDDGEEEDDWGWDDAEEEDDWGDHDEHEYWNPEHDDDDEDDEDADDNDASDNDDDYQGGMDYVTGVVTNADVAWSQGDDGSGVDIALIDTGVSPGHGLNFGSNLLYGPDLSFDSQDPGRRNKDLNGHGTHLAGIIAGNYESWGDNFKGMAPGARIISVKVGDSEGITDVSQVIAAIDWVVQHRDSDGLNIRVLSLSFGTDSVQSYQLDPLAFAVEQAWFNGITVVVAAGNDGNGAQLRNPANDPFVIAVGAAETNGSYTTSDDVIPTFSNCGTSSRHVDLVAPGRSIVSLRAPGSSADNANPNSAVGQYYFLGSGTSQAAAVVAGAAALLIDGNPSASPNQIKKLLMNTARSIPGASSNCQGEGLLDVGQAVNSSLPYGRQYHEDSDGDGSLEASRGSYHVQYNGAVLSGEKDIFGMHFDTEDWADDSEDLDSWDDGEFNGVTWSGVTWSGLTWSGVTWSGLTWSGVTWSGLTWSGLTWSGLTWSNSAWSGVTWD